MRTRVRIEHVFPMIACLLIPGFELRAALRSRPRLAVVPAALAPEPGREQLVGPVTAAAEATGVIRGMRLGEALATCPQLVLVDPDPAGAEREWEGVLRRLEDAGFGVEPVEPGVVVFETRGVERLYGGVEAALRKALASVGPAWDPRAGAGQRRFVALAAASVARPGQAVIVEGRRSSRFSSRSRSRFCRSRRGGTPSSKGSASAPSARSPPCLGAPWPSGWGRRGSGRGALPVAGSAAACAGDRPRQSWSRRSPSPRRSRTSSPCAARSARSSTGCSPGPSGRGGRSGSSRSPRDSSAAGRGAAR